MQEGRWEGEAAPPGHEVQHGEVGEGQEGGELQVERLRRSPHLAVAELQGLQVGERCKMCEVGDREVGILDVEVREGREQAYCLQHILIEAFIIISGSEAPPAAPVEELQVEDWW